MRIRPKDKLYCNLYVLHHILVVALSFILFIAFKVYKCFGALVGLFFVKNKNKMCFYTNSILKKCFFSGLYRKSTENIERQLKYFPDIIIIILALVADNYNTQANYFILNVTCLYARKYRPIAHGC